MHAGILPGSSQLLFIHVPKTAGTTLSRILEGLFPVEQVCPAYYMRDLLLMRPDDLSTYRLFRGHFEYSVTELLGAPSCLTMLREPVARVISYYRYIRSAPKHPRHEKFAAMQLEEVIEDPEELLPISNHQARVFGRFLDLDLVRAKMSGAPIDGATHRSAPRPTGINVERACARLADFGFVGISERFEESLLLLADVLGFDPNVPYESLNVTPADQAAEFDPEVIEKIRGMNSADLRIYDFVQQLFEMRVERLRQRVARVRGCRSSDISLDIMRKQLCEEHSSVFSVARA